MPLCFSPSPKPAAFDTSIFFPHSSSNATHQPTLVPAGTEPAPDRDLPRPRLARPWPPSPYLATRLVFLSLLPLRPSRRNHLTLAVSTTHSFHLIRVCSLAVPATASPSSHRLTSPLHSPAAEIYPPAPSPPLTASPWPASTPFSPRSSCCFHSLVRSTPPPSCKPLPCWLVACGAYFQAGATGLASGGRLPKTSSPRRSSGGPWLTPFLPPSRLLRRSGQYFTPLYSSQTGTNLGSWSQTDLVFWKGTFAGLGWVHASGP